MRFVRLWFTDVLGFLKSVEITPAELEVALEEGMTFDGSTIEGYSRIQESDMIAKPDPNTFELLPGGDPEAVGRPDVLRHRDDHRRAVPRRPPLRAEAEPRAGPGEGLHVLRRARDGVLLLPVRHERRGARLRRLLRPHRARRRLAAAQADRAAARGDGHPGRVLVPRERAEPARDRPALHRRADDGRQRADVPAHHQGSRARPRLLRDVHAEADRRRVRLGDAHAPLAVRRRRQRVPRSRRRVRPVEGREALHRRAARARGRDLRHHEPVGQLVQATDPGLRSARVQVLGAQQPLRARARAAAEAGQERVEPHRVPRARPGVQPVPRVLGDARGGPRRASTRATTSRPKRPTTSTSSPTRSAWPKASARCPGRCATRSTRWSARSSSPRRSASTCSRTS